MSNNCTMCADAKEKAEKLDAIIAKYKGHSGRPHSCTP